MDVYGDAAGVAILMALTFDDKGVAVGARVVTATIGEGGSSSLYTVFSSSLKL